MRHFFQPVKPQIITQNYAENKACVDIATGKKVITCDGNKPPKGYKSVYGSKGHLGKDYKTYHGQPCYASCGGIVDSIDTEPRTGLDVRIKSEIGGKLYLHIYEHLLGYNVKVGQKVNVGDLVGWCDNTGWSSGDHLHFEIKEWKKNQWVSVDPDPLMENIFALEFAGLWKQVKELIALFGDFIADKARK